jgi:hypothetical protein
LPSTMLAHIPGPSAKPSSNTTPLSGRETSHSSQYPRKKTWMLHQNLSCPTLVNYPPVNLRAGGGGRKVV